MSFRRRKRTERAPRQRPARRALPSLSCQELTPLNVFLHAKKLLSGARARGGAPGPYSAG